MKFRKDINGLRAFAVIAVVLFHFNAAWMPGGFAGVDVFFVISGFLMTGIIFKGLENNNFSVINFYVARANRIIPALAALCLALLVFGWFYLTPLEYKALGKHAASSVGFLSNVIYFTEAGYFDAASHEKWLLHTWSLSVEWQFYIIYPLVLLALKRIFSLKTLKSLIIVATVIGFIFSVYATYKWPSASYYLFPMRAWEMMLGGVAFLYPLKLQENNKRLVEILGLVLIVASYIFITGDNPWPGYLALFPVLGTFLVIQAQRNESIITGNIVFQKLGAWSYSIYLWHWPFVVAIYTFSLPDQYIYIGMALSVLLGYLSYKYIERIKFPRSFPTLLGYLNCRPLHIAISLGLIASLTYLTDGLKFHYPKEVIIAADEANNKNPYKCLVENKFPCFIGNKNNIKAIIVGDSHANSISTSLSSLFNLEDEGIIALTKSSCPFINNMHSIKPDDSCYEENKKRMEFLQNNYPDVPLFWVARTSAYFYGQTDPRKITSEEDLKPLIYFTKKSESVNKQLLQDFSKNLDLTLKQLTTNRPILLVLPIPEMRTNVPITTARNILHGKDAKISIPSELYFERNKLIIEIMETVAHQNNIPTLNPQPYLCDTSYCYGQLKGRPLYSDGDHLNEFGNRLLSPMFDKALEAYD